MYFHLPYRQTEGIAIGHAHGKVPSTPNYSAISRRTNGLDVKINDDYRSKELNNHHVIIAIGSAGIKITNRAQGMNEKWKVRKGYLKIHAAANVKSKKMLSMEATNEHAHGGKVLPELAGYCKIK